MLITLAAALLITAPVQTRTTAEQDIIDIGVALGKASYVVGACEAFIPRSSAQVFIRMMRMDDQPDSELKTEIAAINLRLYAAGRTDATSEGLTEASCQRLIENAATELEAATARANRNR